MNLYKSITYMEDLDATIKETELFNNFVGKSVFITGATGLICSGLCDLLLRYNEAYDSNIQVYAAGRNEEKVSKRFSKYFNKEYFHYIPYDASVNNQFDFVSDFIIHGASNAYPKAIQQHPIDTMLNNFMGMQELLEYASRVQATNTVFISSSEVYGKKDTAEPFAEDVYGVIDILNPRSSYPIGKQAAETLCACYSYEKNLPVSIIRPGHIYGPTATQLDNRVSSMFAYDVVEGKDLILKSDGSQIRSYCYVLDCATAILTALIRGKTGHAYNVSNPRSIMSIREIAELFARYGNVNLKFDLPDEIEKVAFNPMSNSSLNSEKLQALGWKGLFDSEKGTSHTIQIIKEAQK
ncbi:MAG: NAD-dependent epimerase/dehydratase family protein [Muricomes sp.]